MFLYVIFTEKKFKLNKNLILLGLGLSAILELGLSIFQITNGSSVQGIFYFLGERLFSISTPGIAKATFSGKTFLRAYGTFSHPNSLGGFYLMLFGLVYVSKKVSNVVKLGLGSLFAILVMLSFSKLSILGLGLVMAIYHLKGNGCALCKLAKLSLLFFFVSFVASYHTDFHTIGKRIILLEESWKIFMKRPLIGVGLGNYIPSKSLISDYAGRFLTQYREPVHNVFALIVTEIGLIGAMLIGFFFKNWISKKWIKKSITILLLILYLCLFDHYIITLQQNILLLPLVFGVSRYV